MKKLIASVGVVGALGIGAFALNSVLPAGAIGTVTTQAGDPSTGPKCAAPSGKSVGKFKGVLDGLVQKGTITPAQEDAIIQAFQDAAQNGGVGHHKGRGGRRVRELE